jgi:hypothetical protein
MHLLGLKLYFMLKIVLFSLWSMFHPVHVTMTSIEYAPESGLYKVFVRMSFNDFLKDCKLSPDESQNKKFSENNTSAIDVMNKYLNEKLVIKINAKQLSGKLNNMTLVDNDINVNLEYKSGSKPENIMVKNSILTDLFSDQTNMIIVKINDFEKGLKLTAEIPEQVLIIN